MGRCCFNEPRNPTQAHVPCPAERTARERGEPAGQLAPSGSGGVVAEDGQGCGGDYGGGAE